MQATLLHTLPALIALHMKSGGSENQTRGLVTDIAQRAAKAKEKARAPARTQPVAARKSSWPAPPASRRGLALRGHRAPAAKPLLTCRLPSPLPRRPLAVPAIPLDGPNVARSPSAASLPARATRRESADDSGNSQRPARDT